MVINILLHQPQRQHQLNGEITGTYTFVRRPTYDEVANRIYSHERFSTDLQISASQSASLLNNERHALHWQRDGKTYAIDNYNQTSEDSKTYRICWGMDYQWREQHKLSLVYSGLLGHTGYQTNTSGTLKAENNNTQKNRTHYLRADYQLPWSMKIGVEATFYQKPSLQKVISTMYDTPLNFLSDSEQKIKQLKASLTQTHTISHNWELSYGGWYISTCDYSSQFFRSSDGKPLTQIHQFSSIDNIRNEQIGNLFIEGSQSLNEHLSFDFSLTAEYLHSPLWNTWDFYLVINLTYRPTDKHLLMPRLNTDTSYPSFWAMQAASGFMWGSYTFIEGNPNLLPSKELQLNLTYMLNNKYTFSTWFSHNDDYLLQILYQSPHQLVEIYKTFNHDLKQQAGFMIHVPFTAWKRWNSQFSAIGIWKRIKNTSFWEFH